MPTLEQWSLWLHVATGTVAVFAGFVALVSSKGGRRHRRAGKLFVASMGVVVATVFVLLAIDPTTFRSVLSLVAVFSGYLAFSGYRTVSRNRPTDTESVVDWVAAGSAVLASLGLGGWGLNWLLAGHTFGIVMTVFGGIGVAFGVLDIHTFARTGAEDWVVGHLQRMVGAFIATVSAVSAVNLTPILGLAAWLWPTLLGTPLIYYWSKKYSSG